MPSIKVLRASHYVVLQDKLAGKAKETYGNVVGDDSKKAEGKP